MLIFKLELLSLSLSSLAIVLSYFLEYQLLLEPCFLCLLQRYIYFILLIFSLPYRALSGLLAIFSSIMSLAGLALALRQLWLASQPVLELESCMLSFKRLLEIYPIFDALNVLFLAKDCAKESYEFLGISLPVWSLVLFLCLTILGIARIILSFVKK